jgi:hypothetical protein
MIVYIISKVDVQYLFVVAKLQRSRPHRPKLWNVRFFCLQKGLPAESFGKILYGSLEEPHSKKE